MVSKSNTPAVFKVTPSMVKLALSVEPVPLTNAYVNVLFASGSVALSVPAVAPEAVFSATLAPVNTSVSGASLISATVITNSFS